MRNRQKVAVSVRAELLEWVERMRKRSGDSRSAVFERALTAYFAEAARSAQAASYVAAYRRRPERLAEQRAALAMAVEALATEPWDAPR